MKGNRKFCVWLAAAVVSTALCAMPTQEEISKAEPLIQELMRDDLAAMRNGKKTREQVGDAAVALAREAQSPAEKYLLLTTAFDHYMRGGSYDKANTSLVDLRTAIPDWKHSDEYALIEKSLRVLATGKGGPVRERYAALKERQQYAAKLKKALAQAQAKPTDKKLQFQVAAYYAVLEHWPQAIDAFLAGSNPACAAAAKLEKESAAPGQVADAWWSASDINPEFLSVAIRAHAAGLYKKAIAANSLAGLQKVAAEKRIAEVESAAGAVSTKSEKSIVTFSSNPSVGRAKFFGVKLVGDSVKEVNGILKGFSTTSYARIQPLFAPKNKSVEVVVEFVTAKSSWQIGGVFGCFGNTHGFFPFFIEKGQLASYLSNNGSSWNIASGSLVNLPINAETTYRVKCAWTGKSFDYYIWQGKWCELGSIASATPVVGGTEMQFGLSRSGHCPFTGEINLTKSYICIDGKLWWEGVSGAYDRANR